MSFIRGIINLKKLVIMDEATSKLDHELEQNLEAMRQKYFHKITTLMITHRL